MNATETLARLVSYRRASQEIRRKEEPLRAKLSRFVSLMQAVRSEPDPFLREQGELVVYAQASILLQAESSIPATRDRIETAARRLREDGLECCPMCEQRLSDAGDWAFEAAFRKAEVKRLQALDADGGA